MVLSRRAFVLGAPVALSACAGERIWAPENQVREAVYRHDGPPSATLLSVFNVGTDNGAHSALLINASQRVIFDPAGNFKHETIPERNDVVYGARPQVWNVFIDYHTRQTYYSVTQTMDLTAGSAEKLFQLVRKEGAVPKAMCTRSISAIMAKVPEFAAIRTVWFPEKLHEQVAKLPGISTAEFRDNDDPNKDTFWDTERL